MVSWLSIGLRGMLAAAVLQAGAAAQVGLLNWQLVTHGSGTAKLSTTGMKMDGYPDAIAGTLLAYMTIAPAAMRVHVDMTFHALDNVSGFSAPLLLVDQAVTVLADHSTFEKPVVIDVPALAPFGFGYLQVKSGMPGIAAFGAFNFTPVPTTIAGTEPGGHFGSSLATVGDVNGDGIDDVIAGVPQGSASMRAAGSARLLSGADGSLLEEFSGLSEGDAFGASVSGAGDVNGDGTPDLIVGAPLDSQGGFHAGSARVFSGSDGAVLWTFSGNAPGEQLGRAVAGAGDVDGDGFADLLIGAPHAGADAGAALLRSGADGGLLHTFAGQPGSLAGTAVVALGDVDGDGNGDVALSAPAEGAGAVRIHSGIDGSLLHTLTSASGALFGSALANAGDLDADGIDDLIVGQPGTDLSVHVFSGASGAGLLHLPTGWECGTSLAGVGDINGDGVGDLAAGAPGATTIDGGRLYLLSGRDGSALLKLSGASAGNAFGASAAGLGDRDGDGIAEIAIGAPDFAPGGAGAVLFQDFFVSWFDLGHGLPGSHGTPSLAGKGLLFGGTPCSIAVSGAPELAPATLVMGFSAIDAPLKGGVLVPAPDVLLTGLSTGPSGAIAWSGTWPAGIPSGLQFYVQAWILDADAPGGFAASNALKAKAP